ncbi:hypothetical protein [Paenibacillus senegalimassiliensis]|uniref:hypothetical protein n=1 Tax=Paenibacillus senegalimassiliensis TaxID=1737426 RepID=UPI00073F0778|nr:hypothetical protein [Paenibacillus senegalimassiliensis]
MAKMLRNTLLYGFLLVGGVTLGMQLAENGTASIYGPSFATNRTASPEQTAQGLNPAYVWTNGQGDVMVQSNAPLSSGQPQVLTPSEQDYGTGTAQEPQGGDLVMQTPADLLLPPPSAPAVDRFADKAAHLLQRVSQQSIHWVASWFDPNE